VHPTTHDVFALTEGLGLYRSPDFGDTWQDLNSDFVLDLLIDKNDPDRFFGGNHTTGSWTGGVYFSINGGISFDQVGLSGIQVGSLSLDASSSTLHCASYGTGIYTGVSAGPRTWYIKPDGTGDAPTIQAGVDSATAGDTVMLANGTFTGAGNRDIDLYSKAIAVVSESGNPDSCIVDCEGAGRGFSCADATSVVRLQGFSITNGLAAFGGSFSHLGGGLYCKDPNDGPVVVDCVFSNNHAEAHGGGVYGGMSGTPVFTNCRGYGTEVCSPSFSDCFFLRNSAAGLGGGVSAGSPTSGSGTFANCVFYGNRANLGGGMYAQFYQCDITNCTFTSDSAGVGGEIYCDQSSPDIQKTIIAFSIAGGAVSCNSANPTLAYCDVYGNAGGDWTGCLSGQSGGEGNFSLNPLFCDPDSDNFGLAALSYCLPSLNPWGILIGALGEGCDEPTGAASPEADAARFALEQNYPNPFNPVTSIVYSVPEAGWVSLKVYDVRGHLVKTLVDRRETAGPHKLMWDGRSDGGGKVSAGLYFLKLESAGRRQSRKLVLLK
jgi:predicted outer membrane repeat protein